MLHPCSCCPSSCPFATRRSRSSSRRTTPHDSHSHTHIHTTSTDRSCPTEVTGKQYSGNVHVNLPTRQDAPPQVLWRHSDQRGGRRVRSTRGTPSPQRRRPREIPILRALPWALRIPQIWFHDGYRVIDTFTLSSQPRNTQFGYWNQGMRHGMRIEEWVQIQILIPPLPRLG